MTNLKLGIECTSGLLISAITTNADAFWLHLGSDVDFKRMVELLGDFSFLSNLKLVMASGYRSEQIHDKFDDLFEERGDFENLVLTVWSEDGFSDSLWEFINVHAAQPEIKSAKILVIGESIQVQRSVLAEISAILESSS